LNQPAFVTGKGEALCQGNPSPKAVPSHFPGKEGQGSTYREGREHLISGLSGCLLVLLSPPVSDKPSEIGRPASQSKARLETDLPIPLSFRQRENGSVHWEVTSRDLGAEPKREGKVQAKKLRPQTSGDANVADTGGSRVPTGAPHVQVVNGELGPKLQPSPDPYGSGDEEGSSVELRICQKGLPISVGVEKLGGPLPVG
jgi:hypothetical protein